MDLNAVFDTIASNIEEEPLYLGSLRLVESGVKLPTGAVLVGIDLQECRHLLVPTYAPLKARVDDDSRGIRIAELPYVSGKGQRYYVDVACEDQSLNRLFSIVAQEILSALRAAAGDPFQIASKVLGNWRQLLGRRSTGILSDEKLAGIWAELKLLQRVVAQDHSSALRIWCGPTGSVHDFVVDNLHVECKATLVRNGWKVKINGIDQLLMPENGVLKLAVFRLERVSDGTSVPDLIDAICSEGIERVRLLELLSKIGYHPGDEQHYRDRQFKLEEARCYTVSAGFPSLTTEHLRGPLPDNVQSISYVVDLAGAEQFLETTSADEVLGVLDVQRS